MLEAGDVPLLEYATPRETLFVRDHGSGSEGELRLLFFRGLGVPRDAEGRAYVPDTAASRILVFDTRLNVVQVVGGPSEADGGLGLPLSVAPTPGEATFVADAEWPDRLVRYGSAGVHVGSATSPVPDPNLAASGPGRLWVVRSPRGPGREPTEAGAPLLYLFDPRGGERVGIDEIEPVGGSAWNRLANAGAIASGEDGTGFFGFLHRNELRAYRPDGKLLWRTRRRPGFSTPPPAVEQADGERRIRLRPVTRALAVGPGGRLYALTAGDGPVISASSPAGTSRTFESVGSEDGAGGWRRLEVYDPATGALLAASRLPAPWTTLAVDTAGRVYRLDAARLLHRAPPPSRRPLPTIRIRTLGGDTASLAMYRGKALLVNFWASWCEPCKRELPQLETYYGELDRERVEFLGISAEADEGAARRFAEGFDLSFPLFLGGERMREVFRFYGLPYTLVVDHRGRVMAEFLGFGNPAVWRRLTRTLERTIERVPLDEIRAREDDA